MIGVAHAAAVRARSQPKRVRAAWIVAAIAMTAIPFTFDLVRPAHYAASIAMYPVRVDGFRAPESAPYVRLLLGSRTARQYRVGRASLRAVPSTPVSIAVLTTTGIAYGGRTVPTITLRVEASTPDLARQFTDDLALSAINASSVDLFAKAKARLGKLELAALRRSPRGRAANRRKRATLARLIAAPRPRFVLGPRARPDRPRGAIARLLASLPGPPFARPNSVESALAGLFLTLAVWLVSLAPRQSRASQHPRSESQSQSLSWVAEDIPSELPMYSIVVVTWNSRPELPALLLSARRHLHVAYRWVFVDNASEDDTVAWLRERAPDATVIELPENRGFGAACNAGVAAADSDVIVLLNPDTELVDSSVDALAELALATGALCGPRLLNGDGSVQPSASPLPAAFEALLLVVWPGRRMPIRLRARCEPWRLNRAVETGWLTGACIAARRDVLVALGPFDERLHHYAEDLDLGLRARAAGVASIFAPDVARVIHHGGLSAARRYEDAGIRQRTVSRRWVVRERLGPFRAALDEGTQVLFLLTRLLAKSALGRDTERERAWLRGVRR